MTDIAEVKLDDLTLGQHVTVWETENGYRTWGQGGVVTALQPQLVITAANVPHRFDRAEVMSRMLLEIEVPTDPRECVDYGDDCAGEVEYFDPSGRGRGVQRCAHHRDLRAERYETSIERYAHSTSAPSWFDPTYAGESWDGE